MISQLHGSIIQLCVGTIQHVLGKFNVSEVPPYQEVVSGTKHLDLNCYLVYLP